jgi:6-pyruvoyl-tetrahydropterin synthase related domain
MHQLSGFGLNTTIMNRPNTNSIDIVACIALIAAAALVILGRQFIFPGVYSCIREDTAYYLNWTRQFADALSTGILYPRWMPEAHAGYGNPVFVFYSPLVIYITALIKLAANDTAFAVTTVKFTELFLSGIFMYMFISGIWGRKAGLASALVYMLFPFRVFDLYFLGVFPSKFAFVWFPLVLHFTRMAALESKPGKGVTGLAISYALLCLTHLLSAYMFAPVIAVFGAVSAEHKKRSAGVYHALLGGMIGLGLAGFFLLPVAAESGLVHLESFGLKNWAHYWNNYLFYLTGPKSPYNPPFYPYLAEIVLASILSGIALYLAGRVFFGALADRLNIFFLGVSAFCLFLMSSPSGLLWATLPGLKMVLFPTRWASVMVFGLACLAGSGFGGAQTWNKAGAIRKVVMVALVALFVSTIVYYDTQIISRGCRLTMADIQALPSDMDVDEYVPKSVSLDWLRGLSKTQALPLVSPIEWNISAGIDITRWSGQDRAFEYISAKSCTVRVRTFFYPGWRAYIDGVETDIGVQPVSGAMLIKLPGGRHMVRIVFKDTAIMYAGWALSAMSSLIAAALLWHNRAHKEKPDEK